MAYVLANQRGWKLPNKFEVKGNFENLRNSVNDKSTDAFMWETFTTKPFYDSGEIRRLGDITTPWPCFMIAMLQNTVSDRLVEIQHFLAVLQMCCDDFARDSKIMPILVAQKYGLKEEDARQWYNQVRITAADMVSETALERTLSVLIETQVIPETSNVTDLEMYLDTRICDLRRDIKSIKLYSKPELIKALYSQLRNAKLDRGMITYRDLLPFDQNHYNGIVEVDQAVLDLKLRSNSTVINIGSGLGGPARYLAGEYRCNVLAIELQDDLNYTASELAERCHLTDKITHICGDFVQVSRHLPSNHFDGICSWNTILHIIDRSSFFSRCFDILKPGGRMMAADFFARRPLTKKERKILTDEVWCRYLPSEDCYKRDLEKAGFTIFEWSDCTQLWREYTRNRVERFTNEKEQTISVIGADTFERLLVFYSAVADLFEGGNLGGIRFVVEKNEIY